MFFDSHAHLDDVRYDEDRESVIKGLKEAGVSHFVNIGACLESSQNSIELSRKYDFIYAAVGVHPHDAKSLKDEDMLTLCDMLKQDKVVALGEIGLDYHYDNSPRDIQKKWFIKQLELASKMDMPVVVHSRDAMADTIEIIKNSGVTKGVMHCFSGSRESAEILLSLGWYISFSGSLTFKNATNLIKAAEAVPMDKLLIETDSPYLSPEPFRGKRNTPLNVALVAKKLAEIKGCTVSEIANKTAENAKRFFNI